MLVSDIGAVFLAVIGVAFDAAGAASGVAFAVASAAAVGVVFFVVFDVAARVVLGVFHAADLGEAPSAVQDAALISSSVFEMATDVAVTYETALPLVPDASPVQ